MKSVRPRGHDGRVRDRWQRWGPLSGVAYVILFLVGILAGGEGAGDTPEEHVTYYADAGNRAKEFVIFFLLVAAGLAFLWFLAGLRGVLVRAEGEVARWTALAYGAGVASVALFLGAASLFVAPASSAGEDSFREVNPSAVNIVGNAGYAMFVCSIIVAALLVLATSIVALRTLVFPRWLSLAGFVVAPLLLLAIFFVPVFLWLAWILAVSVVLILRTARVEDWRTRPTSAAG
jgi:hypothetical protein